MGKSASALNENFRALQINANCALTSSLLHVSLSSVALASTFTSLELRGNRGGAGTRGPSRTSAPASLSANRPLIPHPFRSREKLAPRVSSGGSCAAPYHGELAGGCEGFCRRWFPLSFSSWSVLDIASAAQRRGPRGCAPAPGEKRLTSKAFLPELWSLFAPSPRSLDAWYPGPARGRTFSP